MALEPRLKLLRTVYEAIPTYEPNIEWEKDPEKGEDVWRSVRPGETFKTEKILETKVVVDATKEHPAQYEKWTRDVRVGKTETRY